MRAAWLDWEATGGAPRHPPEPVPPGEREAQADMAERAVLDLPQTGMTAVVVAQAHRV